jgi:hypothetical protein
MLFRGTIALLLAGSAVHALCQTAAAATPPQVPYVIVYEGLFHKVLFLEDVAAKLDAKKKDSSGAHAVIQKMLGLTDQETATLKALAADWQTQMTANQAATAEVFQAAHNQIVASGAATAAQLQQAQAVRNQRWAVDTAHIQQFQAAVGSARFAAIDAAVQATSTVRAMTMPTFTSKP